MASRLCSASAFALLIVFGLGHFAAAASETDAQTPDPIQTLTSAQRERLSEFMQLLPVGEAKSVKTAGTEYPRNTYPYVKLLVNEGLPGKYAELEMDAKEGTVYRYLDMGNWSDEEDLQEKSILDVISAEQAFAAARPILEYLGLPTSLDEYKVSLLNLGAQSSGKQLEDSFWGVKKDFSHEGVPCRESRIQIILSPVSGKLLMLGYLPPIIPQAPTNKITKAKAVEQAQSWLEANQYIAPGNPQVENTEVKYIIALPNDFGIRASQSGNEANAEEGPVKAFYCWEAPFSYTQDDNTFKGRLWVNVETGQVIGGR